MSVFCDSHFSAIGESSEECVRFPVSQISFCPINVKEVTNGEGDNCLYPL